MPAEPVSHAAPATMSGDAPRLAAHRFLDVLRRENDYLSAGDVPAAMALFPEKHDAAAALNSVLRGGALPPHLATAILDASAENVSRLQAAMAVQSRILEIVARAAASTRPQPTRYGAQGTPKGNGGPVAFTFKA